MLDEKSEFEEFLKTAADNFIMTPSQRVWHGIYNNLHPQKKWPSPTILTFMIFCLVGLGYFNTKWENNEKLDRLSNNIIKNGKENLDVVDRTITDNEATVSYPFNYNKRNEPKASTAYKLFTDNNSDLNVSNKPAAIQQSKIINLTPQLLAFNKQKKETIISPTQELAFDKYEAKKDLSFESIKSLNKFEQAEKIGEISKSLNTDEIVERNLPVVNTPQFKISNKTDSRKYAERRFSTDQKIKRWSFEFFAGNNTSSRTFRETAQDPLLLQQTGAVDVNANSKVSDNSLLGVNLGLNAAYKLDKNTDLVLGVAYSQKRFSSNAQLINPEVVPVINVLLPNFHTGTLYSTSSYRSDYVSYIPSTNKGDKLITQLNELQFNAELRRFLLNTERKGLFLNFSAKPTLMLNAKAEEYVLANNAHNFIKVSNARRPFNLNIGFGVGYKLNLKNNFGLIINSGYETQMLSNNKSNFSLQQRISSIYSKVGVTKDF